MTAFKIVAAALVACLLVGVTTTEAAVTCRTVASSLNLCISYVKDTRERVPPPPCCSAIQSLISAASTIRDHQAACKCLKSAATSIKVFNHSNAAGLPRCCGINIPYKISPSTDCALVK